MQALCSAQCLYGNIHKSLCAVQKSMIKTHGLDRQYTAGMDHTVIGVWPAPPGISVVM